MRRCWSATPRTSSAVYSLTGGSPATTRSSRVAPSGRPRTSDSKRMSSARLRALERAAISGSLGDAAEVAAVAGVDLDLLAGGDEQRHVDRMTGLQRRRLGATGRAVPLQAGLGVLHGQLHGGGELDVEDPPLVRGHDRVLVLEQEGLGVAHDLRRDLELLEGRGVHEDVRRAVVVEVLHRPLVDVGDLDLHVRVERLVHRLPGLDVLQLRAHDRTALAGLVVLEPDDGPQLSVEVENHAVLEVVGRRHAQKCPVSLRGVVVRCPGVPVPGVSRRVQTPAGPGRAVRRGTAHQSSDAGWTAEIRGAETVGGPSYGPGMKTMQSGARTPSTSGPNG